VWTGAFCFQDACVNRPLVWAATGFLTGILAASSLQISDPMPSLFLVGLGCALAVAAFRVPRIRPLALVLCFIGAGGAWWTLRNQDFVGDRLSAFVQERPTTPVTLTGTVRSARLMLPGTDRNGFVLDVESVTHGATELLINGAASVQWYRASRPIFPGERVRLTGEPRIEIGEVNPGVHSYEVYLRNQGVNTIVEVSGPDAVTIETAAPLFSPYYLAARVRHIQAQRLAQAMPQSILPFIYAVWLGQQSALEESEYRTYVWSGTAHILSVSGVHAVLIFLTITYGLRVLNVQPKTRAVVSIVAVCTFALVSGASVPAMRAAAMVCLYLSASLIDREQDTPTAFSIAAFALMLWDPRIIFDVSFQLSFACIASILLYYPLFKSWLIKLPWWSRPSIASSAAVQILPTPFIAANFHVFALAGPIANLIVIPLLASVLWLCIATSVLVHVSMPLAKIVGYATLLPVYLIRRVADWSSAPQMYTPALTEPSTLALILYLSFAVCLAVATFAEKSQRRYVSLSLVLLACAGVAWLVRFHEPEVVFLDVGHGDAAYVRTVSGESILIDGGDANDRYNYGARAVAPFLWSRGVTRLDAVVASHSDRDHMGGLLYIIDNFRVRTVILSDDNDERPLESELRNRCERRGVELLRVKRGDVIEVGDTEVPVHHPPLDLSDTTAPNDRSLVISVPFGEHVFLFSGDVEKMAESTLDHIAIDADVLKVPHHGADTSSTPAFIDAVSPELAVISTGARGRQVLDEPILERYREKAVPVLRTDRSGAISFTLREGALHYQEERKVRRYPMRASED